MNLIAEYNCDAFVQEKFERWMRFDSSPPLGRRGPGTELTTLEGETVRAALRTYRSTDAERMSTRYPKGHHALAPTSHG